MLEKLPSELTGLVLGYIPLWELPQVSLVCRCWQLVAFPHLYKTLFFDDYDTTSRLVERIKLEDALAELSLSTCVRELLVDIDPTEGTNHDKTDKYSSSGLDSTRDTENAMMKLRCLERVYWGSEWSSARPQTLRQLQVHHKLQSLDLQVELFRLEQDSAEKIFALEGLSTLYITFSFTPTKENAIRAAKDEAEGEKENFKLLDVPSLFLGMIRASPNLKELALTLCADRDTPSPNDRRSPENIIAALADHTIPSLRIFRLIEYWRHKECPALRDFFVNHPNLHTVDLLLDVHMEMSFDTSHIETIFPSVRNFKGPDSFCRALTNSRIAQQLETLTIAEISGISYNRRPGPPRPYVQSSALPRLRDLEVIWSRVHILDLVGVTPNVERICMYSSLDVHFEHSVSSQKFMNFLRQVPKLRVLKLMIDVPYEGSDKPGAEDVAFFMRQVALICPMLSRIEYSWRDLLGYWDIIHNKEGDPMFHYHFNLGFDLFSDLPFPATAITSGLGSHPWKRHEEWYGTLSGLNSYF